MRIGSNINSVIFFLIILQIVLTSTLYEVENTKGLFYLSLDLMFGHINDCLSFLGKHSELVLMSNEGFFCILIDYTYYGIPIENQSHLSRFYGHVSFHPVEFLQYVMGDSVACSLFLKGGGMNHSIFHFQKQIKKGTERFSTKIVKVNFMVLSFKKF